MLRLGWKRHLLALLIEKDFALLSVHIAVRLLLLYFIFILNEFCFWCAFSFFESLIFTLFSTQSPLFQSTLPRRWQKDEHVQSNANAHKKISDHQRASLSTHDMIEFFLALCFVSRVCARGAALFLLSASLLPIIFEGPVFILSGWHFCVSSFASLVCI